MHNRTIATPISDNTRPIQPNTLGSLNRTWSSRKDIDTTLSDGTPPTADVIDRPLIEIGLRFHEAFKSMTYGPAIGFPFALDALRKILGIRTEQLILLNEGDKIADQIRRRAAEAAGLSDVAILKFESATAYLAAEPDPITIHLKAGGVIQIMLGDQLPTLVDSAYKAPTLAIEIHGNPNLFDQMVVIQGYVGPILGPVAQSLIRESDLSTEPVSLNIPPIETITDQFINDINQSLGTRYQNGVVLRGGCSGALFQALNTMLPSQAIIPQPFFAPQTGIVEAAHHFVSTAGSIESLPSVLNKHDYKNGIVLLTIPNNPDGKLISLPQIQAILDVANAQDQTIIVDATYYNRVQDDHRLEFEAVFQKVESSPVPHLIIGSGSKARTLTKYRVALVTGTPELVEKIRDSAEPINGFTALALSIALEPENKPASETTINQNVIKNREIITQIMDQLLDSTELSKLNSGLQKFDQLVKAIGSNRNALRFEPGHGAVYALLRIEPCIAKTVATQLHTMGLGLVPGDIFSGISIDTTKIQDEPQSYYRISLMAKPYAD